MVDISVWITTYNHESFIAEAIEGVLRQQTNLSYEIVIGEDCSTDRTREIVLDYKEKYPDIIKLLLSEKNLGMLPMTWASYSLCTGKYIAWLDGDDYWIDPLKLQKQTDFLEKNPDFSFCFHRVKVFIQKDNYTYDSNHPLMEGSNDILSIKDFIKKNNPVHALSVVHRRIAFNKLPEWIFSIPFPDLGLYFVLCEYGNVKYIRDIMAVYRVHDKGAYSGQTTYHNYSKIIYFFNVINSVYGKYHKKAIDKLIKYHQYELVKISFKNKNIIELIKNVFILVFKY